MWTGPQDCQKFSLLKPTEQGCCQLILGWTSIKTQEGWPEIYSCVRLREIWRGKKKQVWNVQDSNLQCLCELFWWDFDSAGAMQCACCISTHIKQSCMWQKSFVEWQHNPWTAKKTNVHYVNWCDVYATWLFFSVRLKWRTECVTPLMWKEKQSLSHSRWLWVNLAVFWFEWHNATLFLTVKSFYIQSLLILGYCCPWLFSKDHEVCPFHRSGFLIIYWS